jgi:hypothetical protein
VRTTDTSKHSGSGNADPTKNSGNSGSGSGSRQESPGLGIKKAVSDNKPNNPYQYKSPYMNPPQNNHVNSNNSKPIVPVPSSGSNSRHSNDPNAHKKPGSSRELNQQNIVPNQNRPNNNVYGNYAGNNNVLQKPNILNQHNPHQIIRSDNKNPLIKPNVYDQRNIIKPNNYGADYRTPIVKPSSNYDNKPIVKPNYNYNYAVAGKPSSNVPNQNRFLQAVRPSSGVNKVVKR